MPNTHYGWKPVSAHLLTGVLHSVFLVELRKAASSAYPRPPFNAKATLKAGLRYAQKLTALLRSVFIWLVKLRPYILS